MTICERCISDHGIFPSTVSASYGIFGISIDTIQHFGWALQHISIFYQLYITKPTTSARIFLCTLRSCCVLLVMLRIKDSKRAFGYGDELSVGDRHSGYWCFATCYVPMGEAFAVIYRRSERLDQHLVSYWNMCIEYDEFLHPWFLPRITC